MQFSVPLLTPFNYLLHCFQTAVPYLLMLLQVKLHLREISSFTTPRYWLLCGVSRSLEYLSTKSELRQLGNV